MGSPERQTDILTFLDIVFSSSQSFPPYTLQVGLLWSNTSACPELSVRTETWRGSIQGISFPGDLFGMVMRQSFLERGEMVG